MSLQETNCRFKWPVAVKQNIAASPNATWQAISTPNNLERCHPFCARNPVKAWLGPDSRDQVHYLNGLVFERRFLRWIDEVGYDHEIGRHGGQHRPFRGEFHLLTIRTGH